MTGKTERAMENFYKHYLRFDRRRARRFREECMGCFGWSENTFYNRLKGYGFKGMFEHREFVRIFNRFVGELREAGRKQQ